MRRMGANEQASGLWAKAYRVSVYLSLGSYSGSGTLCPFISPPSAFAVHHVSFMLHSGGGSLPCILPLCCPLFLKKNQR